MPPTGARTSFGVYMVAEQDARGALSLEQSVRLLRRQVRRLPPSWLHRMGRLKARITSLGAQPKPSPGESGAHNRVLMENPDESLKNLHHCRAQLAQAQAEIATLLRDNHRVREQHAELAGHVAHLVQHNQLLTEAAIERARELQEQAPKLTQAYIEIEILSKENERLRAEHAVISRRAAELEAHNKLFTARAVERETKLQDFTRWSRLVKKSRLADLLHVATMLFLVTPAALMQITQKLRQLRSKHRACRNVAPASRSM
jgi:hypothetical protein